MGPGLCWVTARGWGTGVPLAMWRWSSRQWLAGGFSAESGISEVFLQATHASDLAGGPAGRWGLPERAEGPGHFPVCLPGWGGVALQKMGCFCALSVPTLVFKFNHSK